MYFFCKVSAMPQLVSPRARPPHCFSTPTCLGLERELWVTEHLQSAGDTVTHDFITMLFSLLQGMLMDLMDSGGLEMVVTE